jgi:hypothetical protein
MQQIRHDQPPSKRLAMNTTASVCRIDSREPDGGAEFNAEPPTTPGLELVPNEVPGVLDEPVFVVPVVVVGPACWAWAHAPTKLGISDAALIDTGRVPQLE